MKKRLFALAMASVMALGLLAGCGGSSSSSSSSSSAPAASSSAPAASSGSSSSSAAPAASSAPEYEWKLALNGTEGEVAYDMGVMFADKVAELTDGRVKVTPYGGAALGTTTEVLEGMAAKVADVCVESVGTLAPFTQLANIDAMPYMYTGGFEHFSKVWASDLGHEILQKVGDDGGFKLMGACYRGARVVTATKKMETVDDFKGFKLRAPNLEMYVKTWQWMGAAPTPLAMGEVYTALQQHTVEGQENSIIDSSNYSFQEICKYWILTNHVYSANTVIMDKAYFDSLPEDIQAAVQEAAEYAAAQESQAVVDNEAAKRAELEKDFGVEFVEVDNAAFGEKFVGFAEENFDYLADWANAIRDMA